MGITFNSVILRTPTGLLKILEIVLVLACLLMCRFGKDGHIFYIGPEGDHFLAVGTYVGYAIIVPAVLLTYLLGANLTILELFINLIGGILFIATGVLSLTFHRHSRGGGYAMGMALGVISVVTGVVFLIDFAFAIKNTRITVIQTRTVTV